MAFVFNSDLLIGEADLATARKAFPNVFYALDNPELRRTFLEHDQRANKAKSRSRKWGVTAVMLATFALMLAASSDLYQSFDRSGIRAIAILGAVAGITSVFIGSFGVMYKDRKLRWLMDRLATERLRQFHFQHFAAHPVSILKGAEDKAAARAYLAKRERDFETFKASVMARLEDEFHAITGSDDPGKGLFFDIGGELPEKNALNAGEYFMAYETLRIQRQIDYCNLLLSENRSVWKHAPVRQLRVFSAVSLLCLVAMLALDALAFGGAIVDIAWTNAPLLGVAVMWLAFLALCVRTLEEGFQPGTEIERMRQYRLSLNRSFARFKRAEADPQERFEAMMDVENAAFEEMLPFLKTNYEARFVM